MFFYIVLTPISTTSGLWSTGNTRINTSKSTYTFTSVLLLENSRGHFFLQEKAFKLNRTASSKGVIKIEKITTQLKFYDIRIFTHFIIHVGGIDASSRTAVEYFEERYAQVVKYIEKANSQCRIMLSNSCPRIISIWSNSLVDPLGWQKKSAARKWEKNSFSPCKRYWERGVNSWGDVIVYV